MKIRDRLRSLVVRYLGGPATKVTPQTGLPLSLTKPGGLEELIEKLKDFNANIGTHRTPLPPLAFPDHRTGPVRDATFGNPFDDIHAEVTRRLDALDIPEDTSPEDAQHIIKEALAGLPVRIGGVITPGDPRYDEITADHEAQESVSHLRKAGSMPPILEGVDPEAMPWGVWARWMAEVQAPAGWSACRFGVRHGDIDEPETGQMFGITRGDFGVYTRSFHICHPVHDERVLAALIHLPTGTGVGMFMNMDMAVEGAELAMALGGVNWRSDIDPTAPEKWHGIRERMAMAWNAAGLRVAPFHAHDNSEAEIAVWMSTTHSKTVGKPPKGKLS